MDWKRINANIYINLEKVCFFKIEKGEGGGFLVFANFGADNVQIEEFEDFGKARDFVRNLISFTDVDAKAD